MDSFCIDAISHLFEDARYLDELRKNVLGIPDDDYETLDHVYTRSSRDLRSSQVLEKVTG